MKSFIFRNQFTAYWFFYDTSAPITVFVANQLVTLANDTSDANAIAVLDGMIIDVGSADQLLKKFNENPNLVVDRQFADKTITPGFIDPHLHLWLFAMLSNAKFITPADWKLPWDDVKGVVGHEAYLQRLKEHEAGLEDPNELLLTWGYHQYFHGELSRDMLDNGVNLSFHSDTPMAPANPLLLAWSAVNRTGLTGTVLGPQEKITVEEALRAITIGAAYDMGKENEMGSIEVGKRANFAVLDVNPLTTEPRLLKDIVVRATVVDGRVFPVFEKATGLVLSPQNQQRLALLEEQTHQNGDAHTDACSMNYWLQAAVSQAANP